MLIRDAFKNWESEIKPLVIEQYSEDDTVALSESWNDYTDSLCKDGELTDLQYHYCPAFDDTIPDDEDDEREYILKAMGVRLEWKQYANRTDNIGDWQPEARHFKFSIIRGSGAVISGWYSQGSAHKAPPTLQDVISCLLMDTSDIEQDFEDWASDLGFDPDSRKAEKMFKACQKTGEDLERMFGVQELEDMRTMFEDY